MEVAHRSVAVAVALMSPLAAFGGCGADADSTGGAGNDALLFVAGSPGATQLYASAPDGSGRARVPVRPAVRAATEPALSPDGEQVAFTATTDGRRRPELRILDRRTGRHRPVVAGTGSDVSDRAPAWAPDGASLVFARQERAPSLSSALYVVRPDGSGLRRLTRGDGLDSAPAWAPGGDAIAFTRSAASGAAAVWLVEPAGGGERRLIDSAGLPAWSPDGRSLAFVAADRSCPACARRLEVHVAAADGSARRALTANRAVEGRPSWTSDGQHVVAAGAADYPRGDQRALELFALRADGGCATQISYSAAGNDEPDARLTSIPALPCGARVAPFAGDVDRSALDGRHRLRPADVVDGRRLTDVRRQPNGTVTVLYADCDRVPGHRCKPPLRLRLSSSCRRHPLAYIGPPVAVDRRGRALIVRFDEFADIYAGRQTTTVYFDVESAGTVAGQLRRADGRPATRLAPRFSQAVLDRLRPRRAAAPARRSAIVRRLARQVGAVGARTC